MTGQLLWVELDDGWIGFDTASYYLVSVPPPGHVRAPVGSLSQETIDRVRANAQLDGPGIPVLAVESTPPPPSPAAAQLPPPPPVASGEPSQSPGSTLATTASPPVPAQTGSEGVKSRAGRLWDSSKRKASAGVAKASDPAVRQRAADTAASARTAASRAAKAASPHLDRAREATSSAAHVAKDATVAAAHKAQPVAERAARASVDAAAASKRAAVAAGSATGSAVSTGAAKVASTADDVMTVRRETKVALEHDPSSFVAAGGRKPVTAWLLWLFLGIAGGHRFYAKSVRSGLVRLTVFLVVLGVALAALGYGVRRVAAIKREILEFENLGDAVQVLYYTSRMQSTWHMVSIVITVCAVVVGVLWLIDAFLMNGWLLRRNRKALVALGVMHLGVAGPAGSGAAVGNEAPTALDPQADVQFGESHAPGVDEPPLKDESSEG